MTYHEYQNYMANRQRIINLNHTRKAQNLPLLDVPDKIRCPQRLSIKRLEFAGA